MTRSSGQEFDRLVIEARAHHRAGRFGEADAIYRAALRISPAHPAVLQNLGALTAAAGDPNAAIGYFDAAIAAEPNYAAALYNRALLWRTLGNLTQAIEDFECVCALEPEHYEAHRALGFLWLARSNRDRSLDHFARTYELRRGDDRTGVARDSLTHATGGKLRHDAGQFRFLSKHRRDTQRYEILARLYDDVAEALPANAAPLSAEQLERLGDDYNSAIHIVDAPELHCRAVNQRLHHETLARSFIERRPGAVFFDDLLTPPALSGLKNYLLGSTIWHDFSHIGGFVAAYLEDGLACPLLLQIADEIRAAFPGLLGKHPLSQAWAFKGLESGARIDAHADDAAISLNLWLTPDEANLVPGSGGMAVCRVPPPAAWEVRGYETDQASITDFLQRHPDETLLVPYRENRAILFESRLFHRSDAPNFAAGYENNRINLTLLFGHCDKE